LCEHPEIKDPGVEMTTGSLGHGLAFGIGIAMGINSQRTTDNVQQLGRSKKKSKSRVPRVFVLISDGECSEGALWESALLAPRLKLDNLTAILDYNKWECFGRIGEVTVLEPLAAKWRAFGWEVRETDGHNIRQIRDTYRVLPFRKGKPSLILAHTVSGRGIPLIEDKLIGHYHVFSKDEYTTTRKELALQGETLRG
jgi:transketolase